MMNLHRISPNSAAPHSYTERFSLFQRIVLVFWPTTLPFLFALTALTAPFSGASGHHLAAEWPNRRLNLQQEESNVTPGNSKVVVNICCVLHM